MYLRSGDKKKVKIHEEHDIVYENTLGDLLEMYPDLSMSKAKSLKKLQDTVVLQTTSVLDLLDLGCTQHKKQKVYELFARLEMSDEYTEEYFELKKRIQGKIQKIKNPQHGLKQRILSMNTSEHNKNIMMDKYGQLKKLREYDPIEKSSLESWIEEALKLPHSNVHTTDCHISDIGSFLGSAQKILDEEVYGLKDVKNAILRYLCIRITKPDINTQNLALCGPPGVGKTAIAKAVSKILSLPFHQISLGGVTNAEFLKGFESTYVGSKCGQIAKGLQLMKYKNGIIFFDELDKIDENRDVSSALLHITDNEQNHEFTDVYFDSLHIDLSSVWFIFSMNDVPKCKPLSDRLNIVYIEKYTDKERIDILTEFIIPKALRKHDMAEDIKFDDSAILHIINSSTDTSSIRPITGMIQTIVEKLYVYKMSGMLLDQQIQFPFVVTGAYTESLLTKPNQTIQDSLKHLYT
tara:strand:- start:7408 stop:8799 length:1392 start_codon:yes stop_codon:yes gene_type:complete